MPTLLQHCNITKANHYWLIINLNIVICESRGVIFMIMITLELRVIERVVSDYE